MKFNKGQLVVCVASKSEWNYVVPNFDEMLKIALGYRDIPIKGKTYTVKNPMDLHYNGTCYVRLNELPNNIFAESAFEPLKEDLVMDNKEESELVESIITLN